MELIIDTADIKAIQEINELLIIEGVTTNPTIITKSGKTFENAIKDIIKVLNSHQKLFVQVISTTYEEIVEEAKYICSLREKNIYVKIPVSHDGLKAIKKCKELGLGVLATAIYTADQAFLAAMSGADYLAPYVNRIDNYGDGIGEVRDLIEMLRVNQMPTKVMAASFKNKRQVHQLIKAGIQSITVPTDIIFAMINHPGTQIAIEEFSDHWEKTYKKTKLITL